MHINVSNIAANVVSFFKRFRLERLLVVILAGVLLVSTTACNPAAPRESGEGSYSERVGQPNGLREYTDRPDTANRPGLGSYRDNDARQTKAVQAKAKDLVERADQNSQKVQSPADFAKSYKEGTPLPERVRNLSEDVGSSVKQFKEDFSEGAKENTRNLKTSADKAGGSAQRAADTARRNIKDASEVAQDRAQSAVRDRT